MTRRAPKKTVVAFKVESELAELLDQLPNKSDFIRKAIANQLGVACPLCRGEGVIPRGLHDHLEPLMSRISKHDCDSCGGELSMPKESGELASEDKQRLLQFFFGGPLYCNNCYEHAPTCDDCGWHIDDEHLDEHQQQTHQR